MHKLIFLLLFQLFFFYHLINAQKLILKEGDLLFQHLSCGDFCEAIEKVTPAYQNVHFAHIGILIKNNQNKWVVAEAVSKGVCITNLDTFINRSGKKNIFVGRVKPVYKIPTLKEIEKFVGKPYDTVFDINNDAYYCSELVYFLYKNKNGKSIFQLNPMTYKDPETGKYFPAWIEYFKKMNIPIPEEKPGLNPGSMINQKEVFQTIFLLDK